MPLVIKKNIETVTTKGQYTPYRIPLDKEKKKFRKIRHAELCGLNSLRKKISFNTKTALRH